MSTSLIPADSETLKKYLAAKPILWVGAGASIAAGLPSTTKLLELMQADVDEGTLDIDLKKRDFTEIVDEYVARMSKRDLVDLLQQHIGKSVRPTAFHHAVARLAGAGHFKVIITTNYDDLLEQALRQAGVGFVLQNKDQNQELDDFRLMKVHGSYTDWKSVILSGSAYATFNEQYTFLTDQLEVLLTQHRLLLAGCSMNDPRLLDWLHQRTEQQVEMLSRWRALMIASSWKDTETAMWAGRSVHKTLERAPFKVFELRDHDHLPQLMSQVADELAPETNVPSEVVLELDVGETITAKLGDQSWPLEDPLADTMFKQNLDGFHEITYRALPTDERGGLIPEAVPAAEAFQKAALEIGEAFTQKILPEAAHDHLKAIIDAHLSGEPPTLRIRAKSDAWLALPWELLVVDDAFPVEQRTLDVVREAVSGAPEPEPPSQALELVVCTAAPVDQGELDIERENFRLWRALGDRQADDRLHYAETGMLADLQAQVEDRKPPVIHFSGHGLPGGLVFEDDAAESEVVTVEGFIKELRPNLPRLLFLNSCHGATTKGGEQPDRDDPAKSTAAALHRGGLGQVVAYFGPVGDLLATQISAVFYSKLNQGRTTRTALRDARLAASKPLHEGGRATHVYPLGWTQLHLYQRGPDHPPALASGGARTNLTRADLRRRNTRLDHQSDQALRGVQYLQHGFIGRRKPRAELIRQWRNGVRRILVYGLGGLGKTALCTEVLPILAKTQDDAKLLALDGRHAGQQEDPIAALRAQVDQTGQRLVGETWPTIMANYQDRLDGAGLAQLLVELQQQVGSLLIYLDDAESLQEDIRQDGDLGVWRNAEVAAFWRTLAHGLEDYGDLGLVASTRYQPEDGAGDHDIALTPMSPGETIRMMAWFPNLAKLQAEDREWLANMVDGHPRTLEYLEGLVKETSKNQPPSRAMVEAVLPDLGDQIDANLALDALWRALDEETQEHLGRCSVITLPAPWPAIEALAPSTQSGKTLQQAGLLSPFQMAGQTWWAPHRLVTECVTKHWHGDAMAANRTLGAWFWGQFQDDPGIHWADQARRYWLTAGEGDLAWGPSVKILLNNREVGRYRESLLVLDEVRNLGLSGEALGLSNIFLVQFGILIGSIVPNSEKLLHEAQGLVTNDDLGFCFNVSGRLYEFLGDFDLSFEYYQKAVYLDSEQYGDDSPNLSRSLNPLAEIHNMLGDSKNAKLNAELSLKLLERVNSRDWYQEKASAFHNYAVILNGQKQYSLAREKLEISKNLLLDFYGTDQHPGFGGLYHLLGTLCVSEGDLKSAEEYQRESLRIMFEFYETELHPEVLASYTLKGSIMMLRGDFVSAKELMERVIRNGSAVFGQDNHPDIVNARESLAYLEKVMRDGHF